MSALQLIAQAQSHMDSKQWEHAINLLAQAVGLEPQNSSAYALRGLCMTESRQYSSAARDFSEFIRLKPDDAHGYFNRGRNYVRLGEVERAQQDFDKALTLDSRYGRAYYSRGVLYSHLRKYDLAIEDLKRAINYGGRACLADANFSLFMIYEGLGRRNESASCLEQALKLLAAGGAGQEAGYQAMIALQEVLSDNLPPESSAPSSQAPSATGEPATYFRQNPNGRDFGPYTIEDLGSKYVADEFSDDSLFRRPPDDFYRRLAEILPASTKEGLCRSTRKQVLPENAAQSAQNDQRQIASGNKGAISFLSRARSWLQRVTGGATEKEKTKK